MSDAEERAAARREDWPTLAKLRHRRGACPWCGGPAGMVSDVSEGIREGEEEPIMVACCCMGCYVVHHDRHNLPARRIACIGCPGVTT